MLYIIDTRDGWRYIVLADNIDEASVKVTAMRGGPVSGTWEFQMADNGVMVRDPIEIL